jgi:hypothetical protein
MESTVEKAATIGYWAGLALMLITAFTTVRQNGAGYGMIAAFGAGLVGGVIIFIIAIPIIAIIRYLNE